MITGQLDQVMLTIQPDWSDELKTRDGKAWISLKLRGEKGRHGSLTSPDGKPQSAVIEEDHNDEGDSVAFHLEQATASYLVVKAFEGPLRFKVIRPYAVFQNIHAKGISCMDVSQGGLGVSAGDDSSSIMVWETSQGVSRRELSGHFGDVYSVQLFPSGVVVLSSGNDMRVKIWSAEDGSCPRTLTGHKGTVTDTAIVDKGMNVVTVSKDGTLRVWSCGSGQCLEPAVDLEDVANCCDIVHIEGLDEFNFPPFEALETEGDDERVESSTDEVGTMDKLVCVGGENGFVSLVNLHARKIVYRIKAAAAVNAVRFHGCSRLMVGCQDGSIAVHQLSRMNDGPLIIHDSNSSVQTLLPLPEGLVAGRGDGACVYYPFLATGEESMFRVVLSGADVDPVTSAVADNDFVYTAARDGTVRKYSIKQFQLMM